jgi:hypothetical protein
MENVGFFGQTQTDAERSQARILARTKSITQRTDPFDFRPAAMMATFDLADFGPKANATGPKLPNCETKI